MNPIIIAIGLPVLIFAPLFVVLAAALYEDGVDQDRQSRRNTCTSTYTTNT